MMLSRLLYACAPIGALLSQPLPTSRHPGKRASRALRDLGIDIEQNTASFEFGVLLSLWRSLLLLRFGLRAPVPKVHHFLRTCVRGQDLQRLDELLSRQGGLIFATPHYGAFIPLLMKLSQACHGKKRLNVIFNDPKVTPSNAQYGELFKRLGCDGSVLYPDRRGTIAALKALKRGECLAILPDVHFESPTTVAIPFFDRLLRVMPGTAFFATRTGSPIVPIYGIPRTFMGFDVTIGAPLEHVCFRDNDDEQRQFSLTTTLVAEMERQFQNDPAHWNYWESLSRRSSKLPGGSRVSLPALAAALNARLQCSPTLLKRIPGLADEFMALREQLVGQNRTASE